MMIYSGIRGIFIIEWKSIPRHMNPFWDTVPAPRRKLEKPVGPIRSRLAVKSLLTRINSGLLKALKETPSSPEGD